MAAWHHGGFAEPIGRGTIEDDEDDDPGEDSDPRDASWPEGVNGLWQMAMNAAHDDDAEDSRDAEPEGVPTDSRECQLFQHHAAND